VLLAAATSAEGRLARRCVPAGRILRVGPAARDLRGLDAGATGLVSFGFAGGLDPELAPGTLLLPHVVLPAAAEAIRVDGSWHAAVHAVLGGMGCATGAMLAVDAVVGSRTGKQALRARSGAAAVDLESGLLAQAAARIGLPFLVLRVVLDGADDDLPPRPGTLVDASGAARPLSVGSTLLDSPLAFLRLLARYRQASRALARGLAAVAPALCRGPAGAAAIGGRTALRPAE
jgi:hypothetical protein